MLDIDRKILTIDKAICRHLTEADYSNRGMISQDILSHLRNLVEHLMLKCYAGSNDIDNTYDNICKAIEYVAKQGKLKVLSRFHDYLQIVVSHYTLDEENSERLMLKYYVFLLKVKNLMRDKYSLNILQSLDKFPLKTDQTLQEYYQRIAEKIENHSHKSVGKADKYYIQKIKPFIISECVYYEVTFTPANDYSSKFDRVIAFTNIEITDYYAVKFALERDSISILNKTMPLLIITGWEVAIRECEYKNFSALICGTPRATGYATQQAISRFLTATCSSLTELMDYSDHDFEQVKQQIAEKSRNMFFFEDLELCRKLVRQNMPGANIIRYLLLHLNNIVLKKQWQSLENPNLSNLHLQNGCIPFDRMPFIFSPKDHNPRLRDLFECIPVDDREHELLARLVKNNTEIKGQLFTTVKDITAFENIEDLVAKHNNLLWSGHRDDCSLLIEHGQIFISGYKNHTLDILRKLKELASSGVKNYASSVTAWLGSTNQGIDCSEKAEALKQMFEHSKVALIYGAAGTGKTTLINHVAHFFADRNKIFLAQTNPAVDNLKRRVTAANSNFMTITKFLGKRNRITNCDVLVIDECSTVNNRDMIHVLQKAQYKLLLLVGDSHQIASIRFGNWFGVARYFVPQTSVFELEVPFRSTDKGLLTLWSRVREMDETILELITKQGYSTRLDASIFSTAENDEIILCLNYDGLYGINNINRFLQENNPHPPVTWGILQYKIDDPILFNESERFAPVIYNNMKGRIVAIERRHNGTADEEIQFDIELDTVINEIDAWGQEFELLENSPAGNSVIRFVVKKTKSVDDDDEDTSNTVVPFQVAYAVSIHKAQGLEYRSVKIVITDEVDEMISHSIFYTAITRARERLKIYWTPEVENKVLSNMAPMDRKKDVGILRKFGL